MDNNNSALFATFGAVHLSVTSLEKSVRFYTSIAGMKERSISATVAELGSEKSTLVVLHQSATKKYQPGYSGLYHFAIHAPTEAAFAKMLYRVLANNYSCAPTDHTMSKSVYLEDPDGINIEFALETPERFKRVITNGGLRMEDVNGSIRPAALPLNVEAVLSQLPDKDLNKIVDADCKIGHIHFYAPDVEASERFYKKLGFETFNSLPQFMYADVSAGGPYKHRIAFNAWHGFNRPPAPEGSAGLKYYHINFTTRDFLEKALQQVVHEERENGYLVKDAAGNLIVLNCSPS